VLREIGATALNLAGGEIFAALQAGTIDATEWVGPWNDQAFGFQKILKNYMYPGFHEPGSGLSMGINKGIWDGLDAADQTMIAACCSAENDLMMAEFNARNGTSLQQLIDDDGVILQKFPDDVWQQIADASESVVARVADADDMGKRVYESYVGFRRSVSGWSKLSDQAYLNGREAALGI
jgi:TRAP-type mannitol/chloroaromatic compound transport system substrate-binding protein